MIWQTALAILIIVNISSISLTKRAADRMEERAAAGVFYQYLFCALISLAFWEMGSRNADFKLILMVGIVGAINAIGNYCQWRATKLSLSRTAIFFPFANVVSIALAAVFLNERSLWNPLLLMGISLCFISIFIFKLASGKKLQKERTTNEWMAIVLIMVTIFGLASFLMKYFSLTLPTDQFLIGWYCGAFAGASLIAFAKRDNILAISNQDLATIAPASVAILGALAALYWTYRLGGPVSYVIPLQQTAAAIIPVFIGWFAFQERKALTWGQIVGTFAGIAGSVLILLPK